MKEMKSLNEITTKLKNTRRKLVVAGGNAPSVIQSVAESVSEGFIEATLVGDKEEILKLSEECNLSTDLWNIVDEKEPAKIAVKSVEIVRSKEADILMKGFISSADYLHAILNKQYGLVEAGGFLIHIVVMQVPRYHKLLIFSDAAILEQPDLSQKITMLKFCMNIANKIGISKPNPRSML